MNVTTEPPEHCEVLMTVEMDEQEADNLLKTAARRIARQVQIPGFRPGKAPYRQVVQRVGEDAVRSEALEDLGERVFKEALEQSELEPFSPASMEDISWSPLVMKVRVPVEPMVDIGDYRAQRMEAEPVEVGEDDVDEALAELQDEHATWNPVERPAELGDTMVTDIEERDGDRVLKADEEVEYELVAVDEDDAQPDLTTPLLGLSAGDEKTFDVSYPESNNNPDHAGKEITFSVKVNQVIEGKTYPLDDDFAQCVGDFGNIEELKAKLAQDLRRKAESEADARVAGKMLEHIIDNADPLEWHQSLEERMLDRWLEDVDSSLQKNGLTLDKYLAIQKKTLEQFRDEYRSRAQTRIRRTLVAAELIKQEGLSVEGEEVIDRIGQISLTAGERGDDLRQALATEHGVTTVAQNMLDVKLQERLVQIAKGEAEVEAKAK
nr:trigger factor [Ardenticatenia bacterium]